MTLLSSPIAVGFEWGQFIYLGATLVSFAVAMSLFWKKRRFVARHAPVGLALALVMAMLQILLVVLLARAKGKDFIDLFLRDEIYTTSIVMLPLIFLSGFVLACSGAWLSELAGTPPFPLSRELSRNPAAARWPAAERLIIAVVATLVGLAYSFALFKGCQIVTGKPPEPSPAAKFIVDILSGDIRILLAFGLLSAIWEEVFVRIFLLNGLRRLFRNAQGGTAAAVLVSSFVWASGHAGEVVPELVRFLQVFPIGILFSIVYIRRGAEASMLCHVMFNIAIVILGNLT